MGPAEALRAAQLAIMDEYSHPYYWAPFHRRREAVARNDRGEVKPLEEMPR
jgi:hypothetical protein